MTTLLNAQYGSFEEFRADLCSKSICLIESRRYASKDDYYINILGYKKEQVKEAVKLHRTAFNKLISDKWPTNEKSIVARS